VDLSFVDALHGVIVKEEPLICLGLGFFVFSLFRH
jgi:hypothetical protein